MVTAGRAALSGALASLALVLAAPAAAQSLADGVRAVPDPRATGGWVQDGAGVIGDRAADIDRVIAELERDTSVELGVVTLGSIGDEVPKDFAVELFNHWGIGKRGKDNGVLVLHVIDQRRVEIEVGYGLESVLTDARCKQIIDSITIPFFKESSFADGHYETVRALARQIRDPSLGPAALASSLETRPGQRRDTPRTSAPTSRPSSPDAENGFLLVGGAGGLWAVWLLFVALWGQRADPLRAWKVYKWGGFLEYPAFLALGAGAGLWAGMPRGWELLIPVAVGPIAAFAWRFLPLGYFRRKPRTCARCSRKTVRVDEVTDDRFLQAGQVTEEQISSMDYDVWQCTCGWHRVDPYKRGFGFSDCPSCSYRTYRQTSSEVVTPATYDSSGTRRVTSTCAHCGRSDTRYETIPRKQRSSSSSSSSSSGGSSGGSWGGGSSGGGGAGGGY